MSTADDYATLADACSDSPDVSAIRERSAAPGRIKARHQELLDAAMRVTDLANKAQEHEDDYLAKKLHVRGFSPLCVTAKDVRDALGPAYLGGPLQ